MKKNYIIALLLLAGLFNVNAQQDPQYTQYMYNMSVVNPAYAGSKDAISTGLLYRKQWVNIEGAPTTFTAFAHSPVGKNVGLGLSMAADEIGPVSNQYVYGDFSYTLNLGGEHKLSLGLKAGMTLNKIGLLDKVSPFVPDAGDFAFAENTNNALFNIGSGLFYHTEKYYIAASIPNFIKSNYVDYSGKKFGMSAQHYFITGGYVFDINPNFKLKPFTMIKSAFNAPTSVDVSLNGLMYNKFELGVTYRLEDSFGAMVSYAISPNLRLGYAYDRVVSDINVTAPASHEFILLYDINFLKKVSQSSRYF